MDECKFHKLCPFHLKKSELHLKYQQINSNILGYFNKNIWEDPGSLGCGSLCCTADSRLQSAI